MTDRRATNRQRVFKAGTIEFNGQGIECIIRNVSPTGAALEVPSPIGIPHEIVVNSIHAKFVYAPTSFGELRIGLASALHERRSGTSGPTCVRVASVHHRAAFGMAKWVDGRH